jgi:DNA-binding CsgD family transcriptional regulator
MINFDSQARRPLVPPGEFTVTTSQANRIPRLHELVRLEKHCVRCGEKYVGTVFSHFCPECINKARVTPREKQIARLASEGLSNKEISQELGVSEGTIKVYMSRLYRKVGLKKRCHLMAFVIKNGVDALKPTEPKNVELPH